MLLDPLTCGFAKVYFYEVLVKDSYRLGKNVSQSDTAVCYHEHFNNFIVLFKDGNGFVDFSYEQYKKSALKICKYWKIFCISKKCHFNRIFPRCVEKIKAER